MSDSRGGTGKPVHVPSPEEIREATAEIRDGWSKRERRMRKCNEIVLIDKLADRGCKRWNGRVLARSHQVLDDIIAMEQCELL